MSTALPESCGEPAEYTSKPVVITAAQWDGTIAGGRKIINWAGDADIRWTPEKPQRLIIRTLEGEMKANPGDWIIRGTEGEFSTCKDSVFGAKYSKGPAGLLVIPPELEAQTIDLDYRQPRITFQGDAVNG